MDGRNYCSLDASPAMLDRHAPHCKTASTQPRPLRRTASTRGIARLLSCSRPSRGKRSRAGLTAAPRSDVRGQALDRRSARRPCETWPERRNVPCFDRTEQWRKAYSFAPRSFLLASPKRFRPPNDRARRKHPEISPVERIRRLPVHEEDLAIGDDATALPDGKRATAAVMLARLPHLDLVNADGEILPAHRLPGKRQHTLQHGNAARQIMAISQKCRERFWRQHRDQVGDRKSAGRV